VREWWIRRNILSGKDAVLAKRLLDSPSAIITNKETFQPLKADIVCDRGGIDAAAPGLESEVADVSPEYLK
jgi:hypothetical protein